MLHEDLYMISPNDALRGGLQKADPDSRRAVLAPCMWTAEYWDKGTMMIEDKIALAKVMFLMSRLEKPQIVEAVRAAIGRDIEVSEAFFDQYWILDRLEEDGTVDGTIRTNSDHERFPEVFSAISDRIARYVDDVRNEPKPWDPRPVAEVREVINDSLRERVYLISPKDIFSSKLGTAEPEMAEYLEATLPWSGKFPGRFALTPDDETTLVKVMFMMEIVEMTPVADFIAEVVGERVELTEAFFDKYWSIESFDKDNNVLDAIVDYARHPRFPELRSSVNEAIADFIDGTVERGARPWLKRSTGH
jgi:hypothetical protein